MKRLLLISILIFLVLSVIAAIPLDSDVKQRGMSLVGIADSFSSANCFFNPASLYSFNQTSKFVFSSGYADYHSMQGEKFFFRPESYFKMEFITKSISASLNIDMNIPKNPTEEDGKYYYDMQRDVVLNLNAATGFSNFGLGIGLYGGSNMEKKKVSNLLYQFFLGTFNRVEESQFVDFRLGLLYRYKKLSFGITADKVFNYTGSEKKLSFEKALDYISAGFYWADSKYAKRGRLKDWVFECGLECLNIFNNKERVVSVGGDVTLQLTNDYSVSFRTGFSMLTAEFLASSQSFGMGVRLGKFDIGSYIGVPISVYAGRNPEITFNFNFSYIL